MKTQRVGCYSRFLINMYISRDAAAQVPTALMAGIAFRRLLEATAANASSLHLER
jgi:hypothetical protein